MTHVSACAFTNLPIFLPATCKCSHHWKILGLAAQWNRACTFSFNLISCLIIFFFLGGLNFLSFRLSNNFLTNNKKNIELNKIELIDVVTFTSIPSLIYWKHVSAYQRRQMTFLDKFDEIIIHISCATLRASLIEINFFQNIKIIKINIFFGKAFLIYMYPKIKSLFAYLNILKSIK